MQVVLVADSVEVAPDFKFDGPPPSGSNRISRRIALRGESSEEQRGRLRQIANACLIHEVPSGEIRIGSAPGKV
jgi:putative redox protein